MKNLWLISLTLIVIQTSAQAQESSNICKDFKPVEFSIDGQKVLRYNVSKAELMACVPRQPETPWLVKKTSWSSQDEIAWQNFLHSIGKAVESGRCSTVDTCLASSANLYRDQTDISSTHYADCADFPMYLRAYFAYKNNLPFSFGTGVTANPATPAQITDIQAQVQRAQERYNEAYYGNMPEADITKRQDDLTKLQQQEADILSPKDLRYTKNGNYFTSRINVPSSAGAARSFHEVARQIKNQYSSGSYRMLLTPPGQTEADFYPTVVNKEGVVIGTVAYKVAGHVAIVYDITEEGDIKLMDAHPDNSLTFLTYNKEYERSLPTHAAGFKNWRPIRVENAQKDARGVVTSGRMVMVRNEQIPTFSLEQYFGNLNLNNTVSRDAKWVIGGRSVNWFEYVKMKMADSAYRFNPLTQFRSDMDALCSSLKGRATSVDAALKASPVALNRVNHPTHLPGNIYGAEGDWEAYATPGRDLRIRKAIIDIIDSAKTYIGKLQSRDTNFDYSGTNLKRDLIKVYNEAAASCVISYQNSAGQNVQLGLGVALKRMTSMSFDPYFCPERRWGAVSGAELRACADDTEKAEWYRFQQFLRNATERDSNEVMGWSLNDLRELNRRGAVDNSTNRASDYDIFKKLNEL